MVGSLALLDHPHTKHAQDALWGHLAHESEGGSLGHCVEEPKVPSQPRHIRPNGDDPFPMLLRLMLNGPVRYRTLGRSTSGLDCQGKIRPFPDHQNGSSGSEDEMLSKILCELEIRLLDNLKEQSPRIGGEEGPNCISKLDLF
ncbi:hypothetical protein GOBAR_AA04544 [Gossypium barbadense]|uniref:Uncharacterized protein n=1 Tax=Gossypium barbadense TaxID=3634 RepID=A0A2P5YKD8_GOSBA|nr:hypothetical protein GOBAR_AA04544 [Gossypium barbadense]